MLPSPPLTHDSTGPPGRPSLITNHYSCVHSHVHTHAAAGASSLQHHCCTAGCTHHAPHNPATLLHARPVDCQHTHCCYSTTLPVRSPGTRPPWTPHSHVYVYRDCHRRTHNTLHTCVSPHTLTTNTAHMHRHTHTSTHTHTYSLAIRPRTDHAALPSYSVSTSYLRIAPTQIVLLHPNIVYYSTRTARATSTATHHHAALPARIHHVPTPPVRFHQLPGAARSEQKLHRQSTPHLIFAV